MKKFTWLLIIIFLFSINLKAQQVFNCGETGNVVVGEVFELDPGAVCGNPPNSNVSWVWEYTGGSIGIVMCDQAPNAQNPSPPTHSYASAGTYTIAVANFNFGPACKSPCCTFTIIVGAAPPAPACASNPTPANAAVDVSINQDLSWDAVADATSYDVWFGESGSMIFIGNQAGTTYDPRSYVLFYWL